MTDKQNTAKFNDAITKLLGEKLKKFNEKKLTLAVSVEIYSLIFDTLVEVFEASKSGLTNEAMNYVAQQVYFSILINNKHELNPNIFTQQATLDNVETKELALLAMLFKGCAHVLPILDEIKRRA